MKVLFKRAVPNVARAGDVKDVSEGYARNFLIPQGVAVPATPKAMAAHAQAVSAEEREHAERARLVQASLQRLSRQHIRIPMAANQQGTIFAGMTPARISDILKSHGYHVPAAAIQLSGPIKQLGEYEVMAQQGGYKISFSILIERAS